jgi:hypothetical protein
MRRRGGMFIDEDRKVFSPPCALESLGNCNVLHIRKLLVKQNKINFHHSNSLE